MTYTFSKGNQKIELRLLDQIRWWWRRQRRVCNNLRDTYDLIDKDVRRRVTTKICLKWSRSGWVGVTSHRLVRDNGRRDINNCRKRCGSTFLNGLWSYVTGLEIWNRLKEGNIGQYEVSLWSMWITTITFLGSMITKKDTV